MRTVIDPGKERRTINFIDNICFSHVQDLAGNPMDLYLSLMVQNGNSEMRLASGRDDEVSTGLQPLIVWINGAGWRKCDKNLMAAEMQFFAEHGYAVACIQYRHSGIGHFPDQLVDVKTAVRFLRTHAEQYGIDTVCRLPINPKLAAACDKGTIELLEGNWLDDLSAKLEGMLDG